MDIDPPAPVDPRQDRPGDHGEGTDPDYRFTLANERTFLAWNRTALALIAGGFAATHLLSKEPDIAQRVTGFTLVVLGGLVVLVSYLRWQSNETAMRRGQPLPASKLPLLLTAGITVAAIAAAVLLVLDATSQ